MPRNRGREGRERGRALREVVPRHLHGVFEPRVDRPDVVDLIAAANLALTPELVPIRHGRMVRSPFDFYRGSGALMAFDLAATPTTGLPVQACGDANLMNFGAFEASGGRLVLDIQDFDETLPAPWEWDVKRLATSVVLAAREAGLGEQDVSDAASAAAGSYRESIRRHARANPLRVWTQQPSAKKLVRPAPKAAGVRRAERATRLVAEHVFPDLVRSETGELGIAEHPPELVRTDETFESARAMVEQYRASVPEGLRLLLDRFRLADVVAKRVGIGGVGARCCVALLVSADGDPLLLQLREAGPSVLAPYSGLDPVANDGYRIVTGQRLTQAVPDAFLGWATGPIGRDFTVRELRRNEAARSLGPASGDDLGRQVRAAGSVLALAHARTGDAAAIGGYLGAGESFDDALASFAATYAEQTERDYVRFVEAIRVGTLPALDES